MGEILKKLKNSPINYFSDLFVAAMVLCWIIVIIIMIVVGIYSTIIYADNSIWPEVGSLVAVPLSCGGAIWMVKNTVQHAIANNRGEQCPQDFPAVNASEEIGGKETPLKFNDDEQEEGGAG